MEFIYPLSMLKKWLCLLSEELVDVTEELVKEGFVLEEVVKVEVEGEEEGEGEEEEKGEREREGEGEKKREEERKSEGEGEGEYSSENRSMWTDIKL